MIGDLSLREAIYCLMCFLSIMIKCFYYQFTTRLNLRPFFSSSNILMLTASFGMLLVIMGFVMLISNKRRITAIFICYLILTVLLIADTNFYRYYYGIITIPVLFHVNIKLLNSVDQSIFSLFKIKDLIYILDIPVMIAGLVMINKRGVGKLNTRKKVLASMLSIIVGLTALLATSSRTDINAFAHNSNYVTKRLGVLYSHVDATKRYIENNLFNEDGLSEKEEQELKEFFGSRQKASDNYRGIAKGKNLIVVQIEAMQEFVINRRIDGREITPNLNKLIKQSLYFDNIYFQVAGGNTSDAEFLSNTSLYPAKEGSVYTIYPENFYYSLPKAMKEQGYTTYAMHGFRPDFWNRNEMYKALGFDVFVSEEDYEMDDFAGWDGTALSDSSFFRQSLEKIDTSKPFYSFLVTLSSHHPFNYFENYDEFDAGEFEGTYIGNYIKAANYADKCLGEFIDNLKKRGLFDNSLLVLYGDHSAVPKHQADELMEFLDISYSETEWAKLQKVPLIIHYPGLRNGEVESITGGQIDIFPTIANLLGFDTPFAIGKDLLNSKEGYVVLRNGSVITDRYFYDNNVREIFDIKSGKPLNWKDYMHELKGYINELYISDTIIEKDAFRKE
ncbi:MAG TPA: LTA synthase family protein [Clostridiaceae bacterium]|nr:LTA synthase family protein [Clostridiaceae bacterium]